MPNYSKLIKLLRPLLLKVKPKEIKIMPKAAVQEVVATEQPVILASRPNDYFNIAKTSSVIRDFLDKYGSAGVQSSQGQVSTNGLKYWTSTEWDVPKIQSEIDSGMTDAIDYFGSELRRRVDQHNLKEAQRLGFTNFNPNQNSVQRTKSSLQLSFYADENADLARISMHPSNFSDDKLEINLVGPDIKNSVFHEILHRGRIGTAESRRIGETDAQAFKRAKDTNAYYERVTKNILRPREEIPEQLKDLYDYLLDPQESATNLFEYGKKLGISKGAPYPGDRAFDFFIRASERDPRLEGKQGMLRFYDTVNKKKEIWKGLTGALYTLPVGITLYGVSQE